MNSKRDLLSKIPNGPCEEMDSKRHEMEVSKQKLGSKILTVFFGCAEDFRVLFGRYFIVIGARR